MKKALKFLILSFFCIFFSNISTESSYAEHVNNPFYVATEEIPEYVNQYAKDKVGSHLTAIFKVENKDSLEVYNYALGAPFVMLEKESSSTSYYFPVKNNNDIIEFTFNVTEIENKELFGQLSRFLADELQNLTDTLDTDMDSAVTIYAENNNVLYNFKESNTSNSDTEVITQKDIADFATETIDITEEESFNHPRLSRAVNTGNGFSMINFKFSEVQGTQPWCAAYATASILRNKNKSINVTAKQVMKSIHPKLSDAKLNETSLGLNKEIVYAKKHGLSPIQTESKVSLGTLRNNINKGNSVYAAGPSNVKGRGWHAWVIYGWVNIEPGMDILYLSNPWWNHPVTADAKSGSLNVPNEIFTWKRTIYNW